MAIQRLTAAYRIRSRPSSTLGAKASTMCPYYLDGDLRAAYAALGDTRVIGYCAVFKVREEAHPAEAELVSQNSTACDRTADGKPPPYGCQARSTLLEPTALEE